MDKEMFDVREDSFVESTEMMDINDESEIINDIEISEEPEIIEGNEIPEEPEVIEGNEIPEEPEIIEGNEIPEEPEVIEGNEIPEEPEIIEENEIPEEPEIIEGNEIPEEPEIIEGNEIPEEPEIIEGNEIAEEPEVVEEGEFFENSENIAAAEVTEQSNSLSDIPDNNITYSSISEYYGDHNYTPNDYDTYSQDPEWRRLMEIEYPETELPPLNNGDSISDYKNLDTWLKDINPNFDPYDIESPYCNNCGSCAYAVYRRLDGDTNIVATADNIGYNDEMNALTGMEQVSMSPEEIEARLLEQGNGSHAIIGIDRSEGPGHWFNAICKDGKVYAVDGQTGEINEWPPDYGDVVNWEMSIKKGGK